MSSSATKHTNDRIKDALCDNKLMREMFTFVSVASFVLSFS